MSKAVVGDVPRCETCGGEMRGEVCSHCIRMGSGADLKWLDFSRFIPSFSELSLYSMAVAVVLIFIFEKESWAFISDMLDEEGAIIIMGYLAVGVFTLYRCLVHAFTRKRKTDLEKKLMLTFAILTNFLTGVHAGLYVYEHTSGAYAILPVLNILNCMFMVLLYRFEIITIKSISDENVPQWQVVTSTITVLIVFFVFKLYLERQWFFTLAACVFYATNINRPVIFAIERARLIRRVQAFAR